MTFILRQGLCMECRQHVCSGKKGYKRVRRERCKVNLVNEENSKLKTTWACYVNTVSKASHAEGAVRSACWGEILGTLFRVMLLK